jgi:6-phosphogluconolactonase
MSETHAAPAIEAFPDAGMLAEAAAAVLGDALARGLGEGEARAGLMVTGGSTPVACYHKLRDRPLDWDRVDIALTDDRFVPPASPDSNEGLVRRHLLQGAAAAAGFTPLWSEAATPEEAARRAEPAIRALGRFEAVLLGVGPDGHICSLFPGSPDLAEGLDPNASHLVIGVETAGLEPYVPRISLTLPAILNSKLVVILVQGATKKAAIEAALGGADLPVRAVLAQDRTPVRILWAA